MASESENKKVEKGEIIPAHGRGRLTPFLPGSGGGNPLGRPKGAVGAAKKLKEALEAANVDPEVELVKIATECADEKVRFQAIKFIFERLYGKTPIPLEVTTDGSVKKLDLSGATPQELEQYAEFLRKYLK